MTIDNKKNTYRIWIQRLFMAIIFMVLIILIILLNWFDSLEGNFTRYHLVAALGLIYVIISLINYLKAPCFVYYSDQGEMIIMRYYPLNLFNQRKHSIEIPKKQFIRYELKPFLLGTQKKIILYQHFRNKVAKYPPISLSALDKSDREKILASLNTFVKQ